MPNDTEYNEFYPPEQLDYFSIDPVSKLEMRSFNPGAIPRNKPNVKIVIRANATIVTFPHNLPKNVTAIEIINCPDFQTIGDQSKSKIEEIHIESCPNLSNEIGEYPDTLSILAIAKCDNFNGKLDKLPGTLRGLIVAYCLKFDQIPNRLPICLVVMSVEHCPKLKALPIYFPSNLASIYFAGCINLMQTWANAAEDDQEYQRPYVVYNYDIENVQKPMLTHPQIAHSAEIDRINHDMVKAYRGYYPDKRYSPSLNDPENYAVLHIIHRYIHEYALHIESPERENLPGLIEAVGIIAKSVAEDPLLLGALEKIASEYTQCPTSHDLVTAISRISFNIILTGLNKPFSGNQYIFFNLPQHFPRVTAKDDLSVGRETFGPSIIPNDNPLHLIIENSTIKTLPNNLPRNVRSIAIKNCPFLQRLGDFRKSHVAELSIEHCPELDFNVDECPEDLLKLYISDVPKFNPEFRGHPPKLSNLFVIRCKNFNSALDKLSKHTKIVMIIECQNFNQSVSHVPSNTQELRVINCHKFDQDLSRLPRSLRHFEIHGAPNLKGFPEFLPPNIYFFDLVDCPKMINDADELAQIIMWGKLCGLDLAHASDFRINLSRKADLKLFRQIDSLYCAIVTAYKKNFRWNNNGAICFPSANDRSGYYLLRMIHQHVTKYIQLYEDKQKIIDEAKEIADFLKENPNHLKYFEKIAEAYDGACTNQHAIGIMKILNWVKVAKQKGIKEALETAQALFFIHIVHAEILKPETGDDGVAELVGAMPASTEKFINVLTYKVSQFLIKDKFINKPFPGTPGKAVSEESVSQFPIGENAKRIADIVKKMLGSKEDIVTFICQSKEGLGILARIVLPEQMIKNIWAPYAQAKKAYDGNPESTLEDSGKVAEISTKCQRKLEDCTVFAIYKELDMELTPYLEGLKTEYEAERNAEINGPTPPRHLLYDAEKDDAEHVRFVIHGDRL